MGARRRRPPDPDAAAAASEARAAAALTSREVGAAIGVDAGQVRSVESGHRTLPPRAVVLLADVLGLPIADVLGLASPEVRIDAGDAAPLAREVAVLLGAAWPRLRDDGHDARATLAVLRWALGGAAGAREPGVYVAAVPLLHGGRMVQPGEVVAFDTPPPGLEAELRARRLVFVPRAALGG
jgi:hypothetical protein